MRVVRRVFHLYAYEHCTLDIILKRLAAEGRASTQKQPGWVRSKVHRILRDRSYISDIRYHGGWVPGRHEAIIDRHTFDRVQALLGVKIYKSNELTYGGELMTCGHCGRPITGESVVNRHGKVYVYYRRAVRRDGCCLFAKSRARRPLPSCLGARWASAVWRVELGGVTAVRRRTSQTTMKPSAVKREVGAGRSLLQLKLSFFRFPAVDRSRQRRCIQPTIRGLVLRSAAVGRPHSPNRTARLIRCIAFVMNAFG